MGVIYLVRHGQARAQAYGAGAWAQAEGGLTDLGRQQARRTGAALAQRVGSVDVAVSGDLARQRETLSELLTAFPDADAPQLDKAWNEYDINSILGEHERTANAGGPQFQRVLDDALAEWIAVTRGDTESFETYGRYRRRCTAAIESITALAGSGRTVVAVSSAGTITQIVADLWGVDGAHWQAMSRTMINASITKLIVGRSGVSVVSVNEHAHLDVADDSLMTFR